MGGYNDLKTAIAALIHTNDNQEITGATLQSALLSIINTIGQGSVFKGVATTSTNPGSPDANVFYIAGRPGYYPNFNLELTAGLHVIENKSGAWVNTEIALDVVDAVNIGGAKHVKPSQAMIVALQSVEQIPDSEGLANKMWWSTDGHLKYRHNDTVYDLGNPAYVLYYCGNQIYKWTGSGFQEIGGGGTFASGEAVSNMSIFDDGSDTDGKSSAQLAAMIPSGEVIKSLLEIISSIETSGGSYDGVDLITTFSYNASTRVITVKQSGRQAKTISLPLANSTNAGLMSSEDKTQLASLQNLIGKTVKSFNKSTGENGITITLTTYDDTSYTVLIPNSEIDPSVLAGKADKHLAADILTPSQWPRVMLYNIESMWGAGGTPPDYASIPVGSIYLDELDSIDNPPYKRLFYKKTLEGTSQRIDLGAPQENTIYCHIATGKLYRWIPTQNDNDGAFQQIGGSGTVKTVSINNGTHEQPDAQGNVNVSLPVDDAPTAGSNNLAKSGGIKMALNAKANLADVYDKAHSYSQTEVNDAIDNKLSTVQVNSIPSGEVGIIAGLNSDSDTDVLAASQGKIIKAAILTLWAYLGEYAFPAGKPNLSLGASTIEFSVTYPTDSKITATPASGTAPSTVEFLDSFEVTLDIDPNYNLYVIDDDSVKVYMAGNDITSSAYDPSTGIVSIDIVVGDIVIMANSVTYVDIDGNDNKLAFHLDCKNRGGQSGHWIDRIGNKDFVLSNVTEADTGMVFSSSQQSKGVVASGGLDVKWDTATIEIVCLRLSASGVTPVLTNSLAARTCVRFWIAGSQSPTAICSFAINASGSNTIASPINAAIPISDLNIALSASKSRVLKNGSVVSNPYSTSYYDYSTAARQSLSVGYALNTNNSEDFMDGTIMAIRVYKSQLTEQQQKQNYKVDKKRFNLQ